MLAIAGEQAPDATFVQGDALDLPFDDGSFDRVFASYFYCHLEEDDRLRFLAEARRVAPELVIVASTLKDEVEPERYEERMLQDGTRWTVFKRYFRPEQLAERARRRRRPPRRPLLPGRSRRRDPQALELPLARLPPARQPGLPGLRRSRLPAGIAAGVQPVFGPERVHVRAGARHPGRAGAAPMARPRRPDASRAGSGWTRTSSTRPSTARRSRAAIRAGRRPAAATARRAPREQELCAFWREWELELIRPRLIVTVGGLALRRLLGFARLTECVGCRYEHGDADGRPSPPPVRRERLAERPGEPAAGRPRRGADPRRATPTGRRIAATRRGRP